MIAKKKLVYILIPAVALILVVGLALGLIFGYKTAESSETCSRQKLVIDHDGGADDAFAITMSLLSEKYFGGPKVVALTTSFGNVNLNQVITNSDRILRLMNRRDIPIYAGANDAFISKFKSDYFYGYDGLGDDGYLAAEPIHLSDGHSANALIELSKKYEGELIVLAVGPATNLALALKLDPKFIDRLAQLYYGGGHVFSEEHPDPEFNVRMDPEAYYILTQNAVAEKVTLVPFSQVYSTLNISKEWRENVLGTIQTPTMEALNGYERLSLPVQAAWVNLDPVVAAIVQNSSIVDEFKYTSNSIILEKEGRGLTTNNFTTTNPNARLVYAENIDMYKKFLLDVYSAELP